MLSLRQKFFIDRTLGKLCCWVLGPFVRLAGQILRIDHTATRANVRHVIVAKYYGLGSIVHATPLLRELKRTYPDAKIHFLTRQSNRAFFAHVGYVDEVLTLDDSSVWRLAVSLGKLLPVLWHKRIDLFFDLEVYSCFGALVSLFSLARNRIGFFAGRTSDFKCFLYNTLVYMNGNMPIRLAYLQLGKSAGIALDAPCELEILRFSDPELPEAMRLAVEKLAPGAFAAGKMLAVNVNASELSLERRWPLERFADVCRHFAGQGYRIFLVGSREERAYVEQLCAMLPGVPHVYNVAGALSLSEFLLFLKSCKALLTNDTGIMNMAFALPMPVLSLWGPVNPVQYHVDSNWTDCIKVPVYCSPCLCVTDFTPCTCHGTPACMNLIDAPTVIQRLEALLRRSGSEPYQAAPLAVNAAPAGYDEALGVMPKQ